MSSNLRVNNIFPSVGTNVAIGTAGGSITLTGGVTGSDLTLTGGINATGVLTATTFSGNLTGNVTGNVTGAVNSSGIATFSNGIVVAAGTTAAPSISPTGDSNTGIFFPSADTIAFGEGGSEAFRITSTGQLRATGASDIRLTLGSTGTPETNDSVHIRADGASLKFMNASGGVTIFEQNGVEAARFNTSGNLAFTSGKGIDFSATTNSLGTTSSELLSDYEEGTWTPIASASAGTITSYTSSGRYTKVGRTVTLHFIITITNQGTASGAYLNWSGAPYVSANTFTAVGTCREQNVNGFLSTAQINGNASSGSILRYDNNGIIVNGNFCCTIVYEAA